MPKVKVQRRGGGESSLRKGGAAHVNGERGEVEVMGCVALRTRIESRGEKKKQGKEWKGINVSKSCFEA